MSNWDYRLTSKGQAASDRMLNMHMAELEKIRKERNEPDYMEGWCVIDDYDHIKNIDDEIDLLTYGYGASVIAVLREWCEEDRDIYGNWSFDFTFAFGYTYKQVISMIAKKGYLEVYEER